MSKTHTMPSQTHLDTLALEDCSSRLATNGRRGGRDTAATIQSPALIPRTEFADHDQVQSETSRERRSTLIVRAAVGSQYVHDLPHAPHSHPHTPFSCINPRPLLISPPADPLLNASVMRSFQKVSIPCATILHSDLVRANAHARSKGFSARYRKQATDLEQSPSSVRRLQSARTRHALSSCSTATTTKIP